MPVSQESEAAPRGSVLVASASGALSPVQRGATVKPASGEDGQACRQDRPSSSSHSLSSSSSPLCLYPIALTAASLSSLSNPLRLLHNNEAGEGGGLTLPIGEGEGVAVGCGSSLHYN